MRDRPLRLLDLSWSENATAAASPGNGAPVSKQKPGVERRTGLFVGYEPTRTVKQNEQLRVFRFARRKRCVRLDVRLHPPTDHAA
jgi:hypothetical protein